MYYNAVLLPPADLSSQITDFVQQNCHEIADGYCLSSDVLPHITLCQFQTDHINLKIDFNFQITPNLIQPNIRKGDGVHAGYYWIELGVEKTPELIEVHETVCEFLLSKNYKTTGKIFDLYYPHLTFCRTKRTDFDFDTMPPDILGMHQGWHFVFGKSDKNGQFLG